jgi:hypothetical protein
MNFNFSRISGKITFNDMSHLTQDNFKQDIYSLKEDMLQVEIPNNYLLDVGWYPCFDLNGNFRIILVKNYNWENLIYSKTAKDIFILEQCLEEVIVQLERIKDKDFTE